MHITFHAGQRMNHRGITKEMIELVLEYGESEGEKTTLSPDAAVRLIAQFQRQIKTAKKLLDKGGVTVVSNESLILDETVIITTYNCAPQKKSRKWRRKWQVKIKRN